MVNQINKKLTILLNFAQDCLSADRPKLVYSSGWLGNRNLGDEALFVALKNLFNTFSFMKYGKESKTLKILYSIAKPSKVALLAGGTIINRDSSYLIVWRDCLEVCGNGIIFGTGVADPDFWQNRIGWKNILKDWKTVLKDCKYIGVRGPRSQQILADVGINAEVIGDPVISLADKAWDAKRYLSKSICLNIGQTFGNQWGNDKELADEYFKLAFKAKNNGWNVRWLVVWPEDFDITMRIARESGTENEVYEVYSDSKIFMNLVRTASVFLGMKLHAVVLATCSFVPSIMVEYRPKCRDYMESIEQEMFTVKADNFSSDKVWDLIKELDAHREEYSKNLYNIICKMKENQIKKAICISTCFK